MNSMWKRSFALLLSLVMVFGMVPVNAFAEETECSHSYKATVTDPTCTAVGYTTYTCACGDTYKADEVAATGHSYADGICSVCGAEEHTHSYEAVVTAPTCGEAGFTTYTCACGDTYTADEVAATGHSYAEGICSVCGAEEPAVEEQNEEEDDEIVEEETEEDEIVEEEPVDDPCVALGCTDDAHAEGCPYTIPCDLNEGCKKHKGHYGECEGMIVYTEPVAQVDGETFATLADAVTAAGSEGKITLLADAELVIETTALQPDRNVHVREIDLGGKTMTLGQTDYRFGNTTIKNGKIVVKSGTVSKTAIFYMFGDNTLVFDNVTVEATGVSGTYLVGLNDTSDFKMQNGSKIVVENDSTVSLGTLVASNGSDNTVTIENSEISAQNLGHGFLGGNHSVSGSKIQLTGMKSSGYFLRAKQKLNVADKSEITVTGDTKYGQIYQTDLTVEMTVDKSSAVTAKVVNAAHVAYIDETGYVTLDAALKDAADGDTIELLADVTESVTINKPITLNGNGKKLTGDVVVKANTTFKGDFAVSGNVKAGYGDHSVSNMEVIVDGNLSAGYFYLGNKSEHYSNGGEHKLTINSGAVLDAGTLHVRTTGVMTAVNATVKAGDLYVRGTMTVDGCTMSHQSTVSGGTGHWAIYEDDDATKTASLTLNNSTASGNYLVVGSNSNSETDADSNAVLTVNGGSLKLNTLYVQGKADVFANNAATFTNAEVNVKNAFVHAKALMNVSGSTVTAETIKNAGTINVSGNSKVTAPNVTGGTVNVAAGTVLTDTTLGGTANTSFKTGVITFNGENKITTNIDDSVSNFDFVVNKGATLLIPRYTLGYGRDITVNGNIVDAFTFEPGDATPSLKANSSSGFSISGTGTTALTAENAYLEFDSSSWKNAYGIYNWNFKNSYVSAASFGNNNGPASDSAAWNVTFDDSVLVSNYIKNGKGVTYSFTNGSTADVNTIGIDGVLNIDATSTVTVKELQNNVLGTDDEHGDILGTVNVAGKLIFGEKGSSMDLLGGKINVLAGGEMAMSNKILYTYDDAVLTVAVGGTLSTAAIKGDCKIVIDAKNYKYGDASPVIGKVSTNNIAVINNEYVTASKDEEGNIVLTGPTVYTKDKDGKTIGGYTNLEKAITAASTNAAIKIIEVQADINQASAENSGYHDIPGDLTICSAEGGNYEVSAPIKIRVMGNGAKLTIAENVTIENLRVVANGFGTTNESMVINGALKALTLKQWTNNNSIIVNPTGTVELGYGDGQFDMANGNGAVTVTGNGDKTVAQFKAGYSVACGNGNTLNLKDTYFEAGAWFNIEGKNSTFNADNALLKVSGGDFAGSLNVTGTGNVFNLTNGGEMNSGSIALGAGNTINVSEDSKINAATISGAGKLVIDATGMTAGVYQNVKGNVANFTGTIEVVNNDTVVAKIVADEGAATKHIELVDVVAVVDGKGYATLEEAVDAANGKTVVLVKNNLTPDATVTVGAGKTVTIDLNKLTLKGTILVDGGNLTIKNGTIQNKNAAASAIAISGGELSMSKMTVESAGTAVSVSGTAKAAITSGTYTAAGNAVALNVTGGTLVLTGGTYDMDCREYCKADYAPKNNGDGTWTVVKAGASAVINGKTEYFYSLAEAAEAAKAAAEAGKSVTEITRLRNNTDSSYDQPIEVRGVTIKGLGLNGTMEVVLGNDDVAKVYSDNTVKVTVGKAANDSSKYPSVEINTYESNGAKKTSQRVYVKDATVGITISKTTQDLDAAVEGEYMVDAGKNGIDSNDVYSWFENHTSEYKRGSAEGLKVTSTGFYNSCTEIKVDGVVIYTGNWKHDNIDVYPGSTVLVMSNKYLETLGNGDHIVTFTHKINGNTFTTSNTFKITAVYNANADKTNPKTGDEIFVPMFVMFSTAAALAVLVMGKKKYF